MAGETVITIVGNLAADPELRFTGQGRAVASLRIGSTPRTLNRQTNAWEDGETLWLRATIWGQPAEHAAESLMRGMRVIAQGRLKQRTYETKEGEKRTVYELDVDEIGPSLRNATAKVAKADRQGGNGGGGGGGQAPVDDPWANVVAGAARGGGQDQSGWQEPPF